MTKEQIQNYFYNLCSKKQALEVECWLANFQDGSDDDDLLRELLEEISVENNDILNTQAFTKFERLVQTHQKTLQSKNRFVASVSRMYQYAAAILLLPLLVASVYFYIQNNSTPKEWIEEYVPYGESKIVHLPDKSKIWLNAGTKLIYPKKFNTCIRQVFVTGEAYIEVTKDKSRPFLLSAGDVSVEVLGTKFNIKSYSEDSYAAVSLMEGSVRMKVDYKGEIKTELLKPGDIVKFKKSNGELERSQFVVANGDQWYDGKGFYFIDESLSEIVLALERYFNVRINIENEAFKKERYYSIFINNESLDEILSALNANGKMKIRRQADMIYLY